MGCRSSKPEETPPVALCRERQELICAAADHRYALAAAHTAYFRALGRVGDALHRFVQEELTPPPDSPVLTLPPSEGKGKGKGKEKGKGKGKGKGKEKCEIEESESNVDRIDVASSISLSNSDDSHLHFHSDVDDEEIHEENGGFRAGSGVGDGQGGGGGGGEKGGGGEGGGGAEGGGGEGGGGGGGDSWYYPPYPPHLSYPSYPSYASYPSFGNVGIPNYYYMKKNATKPTTVYQEPYGGISKPGYMAYGYGYDNPMYGFPMDSGNNPVQDQGFYQSQAMVSPQKEVKDDSPPPPPPPPEGSSWDFFNPFDSYEQMFPGYGQGGYGVASVASSPNSSEVREREGIPDLEEETEQESVKEAVKEKEVVESSSEVKDAGIGVGSSEATAERKEAETDHVVVSETASQGTFKGSKVRSSERKADVKVKQVSFEEDKSLVTDDSGPSKGSALFACGTRDVEEVVKEIKEQFNSAASCGEEVSKMLEVGRMRHRSRNKIVRFILSRIFDHIALPVSTSQLSELEKINDIEFSNLSSVLDRLCTWEKKLYKEVKDEEKLRLIYDREWKHLKALDDNGAEPSEIDAIRASIRTLLTRINIAVRSVNAISSRIHKLRDDELQPQLMKLIQGQIRMWKFVLDCHQKQFLAVVESRAHDLVPKTGMQITAASKATMELELELLNWRSCFRDWIRTQRDYVKALNEWLLKWLLQEKEETPDGVAPFSPCRMGAPAVFVTSNDWYQATETLSESGVTDAMQAFAINVHMLWERQGEEQQQKQKADYLSKDFAKRLLYLQKENGMDGRFDLDKSVIPIKSNNDPFHDRMMALDALQKRLAEERAKHEETIKHVQEASAGNLRVGLMPIFEALSIFSSETLKGYEGIRMEKGSRVT